MTEILQMKFSTQWTLLLNSCVILDFLWLEIFQQFVKHQEAGVYKHQHALVMKFKSKTIKNILSFLRNRDKTELQ